MDAFVLEVNFLNAEKLDSKKFIRKKKLYELYHLLLLLM